MKSSKSQKKRGSFEHDSFVTIKEDDDADYKPILQGFINTRCNYDGSKIEGCLD